MSCSAVNESPAPLSSSKSAVRTNGDRPKRSALSAESCFLIEIEEPSKEVRLKFSPTWNWSAHAPGTSEFGRVSSWARAAPARPSMETVKTSATDTKDRRAGMKPPFEFGRVNGDEEYRGPHVGAR